MAETGVCLNCGRPTVRMGEYWNHWWNGSYFCLVGKGQGLQMDSRENLLRKEIEKALDRDRVLL